jgi:hypothetical protein
MTSVSGSDESLDRGGTTAAGRSWRRPGGCCLGRGCGGGEGSGPGWLLARSAGTEPVIFAIRSATATPSVWLPVVDEGSSASGAGTEWRSHGAAVREGRGVRVSHWWAPSRSDARGRPGVASLSPSLMSLPASDPVSSVRVGALESLRCRHLFYSDKFHGPATGAANDEIHIVLRDPERRNVEMVSVHPPECITSAPVGTVQSSGSVSQPSGSDTDAGEP